MSSVVPLRSSSCQSPDLVLPRPFPSVLTTRAFDHSRRRWFGTCSCQPVPRGLPSSIKQLHTLGPPRPFALVAHCRRRTGRQPRLLARSPCARRPPIGRTHNADRCSPAAGEATDHCGVPISVFSIRLSPSCPLSAISGSGGGMRRPVTRRWTNFRSQSYDRLSKKPECQVQNPVHLLPRHRDVQRIQRLVLT